MYILNKKTKTIQECRNKDAIKVCREDPDHYQVAETAEELREAVKGQQNKPQEPQNKPQEPQKDGKAGENTTDPQKAAPEAPKKPADGENEPQGGTNAGNTQDQPANGGDEDPEEELMGKTVSELRSIAKEKGIQGYNNMNKQTLVAMILNH